MSGVFYDVDDIERYHRAMLADMLAQGNSKTETDEDRRLLNLQAEFYELVILASKLCATAENMGHSRFDIGKALGVMIGTAKAQFIGSNRGNIGVTLAFQAYEHGTIEAMLNNTTPEGAIMADVHVARPMQGGHA